MRITWYKQFNGVIAKYRNGVKKRLYFDECAMCHQLRKKEKLNLINSKTDNAFKVCQMDFET
jgi:hypothetical protein